MSRLLQIGSAVLLGALIAFGALAATPTTVQSPAHAKAKSPARSASHRTAASSTKSKTATQPVATRPSELAMPVPMPVGSAGLRAYVDPETGVMTTVKPIGMEPVEIDPMNDSDVGLTQVTLPGGHGVMIDLQGRYQEYMVVRLDASGHRVFTCEKNPKLLKTMLSTPAISPYAER
jgi:hypothetical protein